MTETIEKSPAAWKDSAGRVPLQIRPFIGGEYHASTANERFADINPANEQPLAEVAVGSAADVDAAVRIARRRFDDGSWSEASLPNGTPHGLDSTVWTRDSGRARRMAHGIRAASLSVRSGGEEGPDLGIELSYEPQKASGFGSEAGLRGLQSYSALKFIQMSGA